MLTYIATSALLAAGSVSARGDINAPFRARTLQQAHAGGSASSSNTGGHYTHTTTPKSGFTYHDDQVSGIECKGTSKTSGWSAAKDAHAYAVTEAIKYGCSHDIDKQWAKDIEEFFKDDFGFAVAEVWAVADAKCTGSGNVYGCASAYASAKRWASFTASAYASAYADAWNYCECNDKDQIAGADAFGTAYEMETLTATVSAVAEADACIHGTGSASAHVESHCLQAIYANVFAKSISTALIKGKCYTKLKADADITAVAGIIDKWEYVDCASHASYHY